MFVLLQTTHQWLMLVLAVLKKPSSSESCRAWEFRVFPTLVSFVVSTCDVKVSSLQSVDVRVSSLSA